LLRPRPNNPAEPRKRPSLSWPQPKRNPSNKSVDVNVKLSLLKYPTEKDLSPYRMPYMQVPVLVAQRGVLPMYKVYIQLRKLKLIN
jgi:hypothetical protein